MRNQPEVYREEGHPSKLSRREKDMEMRKNTVYLGKGTNQDG